MSATSPGHPSDERPADWGPAVVGLGASAGGLAALQRFFEHVPADSGLAWVVVMHLSPDYESHLAELLQTHASIPVVQLGGETELEPDRAYVIPPNRNLATIDSHLRLTPLEDRRRDRAPIDHFFRTLAGTHKAQAVAVVLSGTGSDGSLGIGQIKEEGGLTVAQDPEEAEHPAMPSHAIATGQIEMVLPIERMPGEILRYFGARATLGSPETQRKEGRSRLEPILDLILERTGHDFAAYKPSTLQRRISRRMQIVGSQSPGEYLKSLEQDHAEIERLQRDLLITVTSFFRDPDAFATLERTVIPKLFENRGTGDEVRAWSIGCATGEEPYSLAMLLLEHAHRATRPPNVQVFASDVNDFALQRAREAVYPRTVEADVSAERIERFFTKEPGGNYRVKKLLREHVVFARHNVMGDPPFAKLDLLVCRNLLIYLKPETQREMFSLFHYALLPGGYVFLGSSESAKDGEGFRTLDKEQRIFVRQRVRRSAPRLPNFPLSPAAPPGGRRMREWRPEDISYGTFHARLAERHAPPSLLVAANHEVVHRSQSAGRYLWHAGGEPSNDVSGQVRPELRGPLREALAHATERVQPVTSLPVPLVVAGETVRVAVHVRPANDDGREGYLLVLFYELPAGDEAPPERGHDRPAGDGDVEMLRQRLQAVVHEHEVREEESRATNEELQSMNEELRSTTEELETSKEELQSMNEELVTINQENRQKVEELLQLTSDLNNLLSATDIATIFLDRELRIRRFTPRVHELFNVVASDKGRPLADFTHKLGYDLKADAARVLKTLQAAEREVKSDDGDWYLVRVVPYRTADDRIDGVVVTLVNVSPLKLGRRLKVLASQLTMAEQRERERIAQVLHDDIQQLLFSIMYRLHMLEDHGVEGASELASALEESRGLIQRTIDATRTLATEMSPPVLKNEGLPAMIRWLASHMGELHELDVDLQLALDDVPPVSREERVLLYHSVRELLFNVVKHAGVHDARIEGFREDGAIVLSVIDRGTGFDAETASSPTDGFGLSTLRERLELMGGSLTIDSSPGHGARAEVRLSPSKPRTS